MLIAAQKSARETALMLAASEGHLEIAQLLLRSGASRLIKDRFGRTAWMHAIDGGNVELVKLLAKDGYPASEKLIFAASGAHRSRRNHVKQCGSGFP